MNPIKLTLIALLLSITIQETCKVGTSFGTCISASSCKSKKGKSTRGFCIDASNICCTGIPCGKGGICTAVAACNGKVLSNLCPGGNYFKCCVNPNISKATASTKSAEKIVQAARSMIGKWKYSWGGGNIDGATKGIIQDVHPFCDDRNIVGFDCSGLSLYSVYQGTGITLIHRAQRQYDTAVTNGNIVPTSNVEPGDLVFFGNSTSSITHVAIVSGNGKMIEAHGHYDNCTGKLVLETDLREPIAAARFW